MSTPSTVPRDRIPFTEKAAPRGIIHLRRVIAAETAQYEGNEIKIARLQAAQKDRVAHIEACKIHLAELEQFLETGKAPEAVEASEDGGNQ